MKKFAFLLIAVWMVSPATAAIVISSTSFESEAIFGGVQYTDTGDAAVDHDLLNNAGEPVVDSTTFAGGENLGFDASYFNTRDGVGLTDGDFVGVTDFTGAVGAFTDGSQGYQIADPDGLFRLEFAAVDIAGLGPITFELDYFAQETGWEDTDLIRIGYNVDGDETLLLDTTGSDIDDLAIEDAWNTLSDTFEGSSVFAFVELDSNSGSEALFLDRVSFSAVPEPGSLGVIGLGLFAFARRRRN